MWALFEVVVLDCVARFLSLFRLVTTCLVPDGRIAALVSLRNMTSSGLDLSVSVSPMGRGVTFVRLCTIVKVDTVLPVELQVRFERMLIVLQSLGQALFTTVVTVLLVDSLVIKIWLVGTVHRLCRSLARLVTTVGLLVLCTRLFGWN